MGRDAHYTEFRMGLETVEGGGEGRGGLKRESRTWVNEGGSEEDNLGNVLRGTQKGIPEL